MEHSHTEHAPGILWHAVRHEQCQVGAWHVCSALYLFIHSFSRECTLREAGEGACISVFTNKVRVHKDFGDEEWRRCEAEACHLRVFKTCRGEPWGPAWHHREPGSMFCKKTAFLRCPAFPHIHTLVERQEQDAVGGAQMCSSPGRKSLPLRTCFSAVRLLGEALILSFKGFILVH